MSTVKVYVLAVLLLSWNTKLAFDSVSQLR
jgi:hypothetical protein